MAVAASGAVAADAHGLNAATGGSLLSTVALAAQSTDSARQDAHYIGRAIRSGGAKSSTAPANVSEDPRARAARISSGGTSNVQAPAPYAPAIEGNLSDAGSLTVQVEDLYSAPSAVVDAQVELDRHAPRPYILGFAEAPVATYRGGVISPAGVPRADSGRLDVHSSEAVAYADALESQQLQREQAMTRLLGRQVQATHRMQHAFNGIIVDLTPAEAERLASMRDIALMEPYAENPLDTDTGPLHINADAVWMSGTGLPGSMPAQGEGIVFGIIDSGVNSGSPSFAAVDMDGYQHVNPLGEGNYLGTCDEGGIDEGRCNDKLIGGYDFICSLTTICQDPNLREVPGFRDENGHGSHVGSTVAGNRRMATFLGNEVEISGVAPRGNLVFFDTCYTNAAGQGLCPNVSTLAAVNQAVADGVVDALSYSIGGGTAPWSDALSLAFLSATEAGIFVSASGGNSGPGAFTVGHNQPWVHTIAAAQHGRGAFVFQLLIDGAPAGVSPLALTPGGGGVAQTADIPSGTPLVVSPGIDSVNDGCAAFPEDTFDGAIAMVRRGTCAFSDKVNNAQAAGAIAVIVANNAAGAISPSVPGTTIPAYGALQADSNAVRDWVAANAPATAGLPAAASPSSNVPDQLAAFSSRGPVNFDLIKPDITAPGVAILAAYAGPEPTGFDDIVNAISGTSMSQPHNAGSAGLLRQLHPGWSVYEIKSALMMTAVDTVLLENSSTPANPFAGGSGSLRVDRAARAGLVLDETGENFLAANPATGGDPSSLNLASMASTTCIGTCTFTRTFRSVAAPSADRGRMRDALLGTFGYTASIDGLDGLVSRSSFTAGPGQTISVDVTIDASGLPANGSFNFGTLVLTPADVNRPTLRLPIAVAVPAPTIAFAQDPVAIAVAAGATGSGQTSIGNAGGGTLEFSVQSGGQVALSLINQPRLGNNNGTRSGVLTNVGNRALLASDDFPVAADAQITFLRADGFISGGQPVGVGAQQLVWAIFPDEDGAPAGNPVNELDAAVWSYSSAPNGPGVGTTDNIITLNLAAAGQTVNLEPGNYWLTVHSVSTLANNWIWFFANAPQSGSLPLVYDTAFAEDGWVRPANDFPSLALRVDGELGCGAPWISSVTPAAGNVAAGNEVAVNVAVDASGLEAGSYSAVVCVGSNDPARAVATFAVQLNVN